MSNTLDSYIPKYDIHYVPWGNFELVKQIIASKKFYPIWVTGLAGCGKTQMIEQACASVNLPETFWKAHPNTQEKLLSDELYKGRPFIRVNFTSETDEAQLLGSYTLVNGNTVFQEGPIPFALRNGMILLLDEIDAAHPNKILCLQSVLEGRGVFVKEKNEFVHAQPGFQVFATSNTRGRGSDDGKFSGLNIMNGAFLDRFAGTMEQVYPDKKIEERILTWTMRKLILAEINKATAEDMNTIKKLISTLVDFANLTRKAYNDGASDELITTRTLIATIQGFSIFGDVKLALKLACQRFSELESTAMISAFDKVNGTTTYNLSFMNPSNTVKEKAKETSDFVIKSDEQQHIPL